MTFWVPEPNFFFPDIAAASSSYPDTLLVYWPAPLTFKLDYLTTTDIDWGALLAVLAPFYLLVGTAELFEMREALCDDPSV